MPSAGHDSGPQPFFFDLHADTPQRFLDEAWDFTGPLAGGMLNLSSARAGNLGAEFFALWVDPAHHPGRFAARALDLAHSTFAEIRRHPDTLALCLTPADVLAAQHSGRFAVLLGLEGGHSIENSLDRLREFHALGCRYMTLTWNNSNEWADSSHGEPLHHGLTPFGREVIAEMNRLGMMVDISHVSDQTFADVLACSHAPVIASHSSARTITPAARNLTDAQLRAIADRGGIACLNLFPAFLCNTWRLRWEELRPARQAAHAVAAAPFLARKEPVPYAVSNAVDRDFAARIPRPAFTTVIDHLDHMLRIAGAEHVGLGTDFDGIPILPEGIDSAADLSRILDALRTRGYTSATLENLMFRNALRVFADIQSRATP